MQVYVRMVNYFSFKAILIIVTSTQIHSVIVSKYYEVTYEDLAFPGLVPKSRLTNIANSEDCATACARNAKTCKAFSYKRNSYECGLYEICPDTTCHSSTSDPGMKVYCIGNIIYNQF